MGEYSYSGGRKGSMLHCRLHRADMLGHVILHNLSSLVLLRRKAWSAHLLVMPWLLLWRRRRVGSRR